MVLGITATPAARAENVLSDGVPQFATAPDGYRVSYFEYGKKVNEAPTIVITGTWPWSSEVLEPLIRILSKDYHVVRYDQRGYGASSKPNETSAYTLEKLAREFGAVIDKVAPKKKVHVFGLEWGSYIYSEYAYLFRKDQRISSFTTLGQPSLDISSQRTRDAWEKGDNQEKLDSIVYNMRASFGHILGYTPVLPDLAILSGLPEAVINKLLVAKGDWEAGIDTEEAYYGRKMMKANLVDRQLNPATTSSTYRSCSWLTFPGTTCPPNSSPTRWRNTPTVLFAANCGPCATPSSPSPSLWRNGLTSRSGCGKTQPLRKPLPTPSFKEKPCLSLDVYSTLRVR